MLVILTPLQNAKHLEVLFCGMGDSQGGVELPLVCKARVSRAQHLIKGDTARINVIKKSHIHQRGIGHKFISTRLFSPRPAGVPLVA
jgi:hypothetical protein